MQQVHVFVSTGRFCSLEEMRAFIHMTYTEDGERVPSPFMGEVGLTGYEPACIEVIHAGTPTPLTTLLAEASYADQWMPRLDGAQTADAAICVFPPNRVMRPSASSLRYIGAYDYESR